MMTPQEVANCTFAKAVMGGYNMAAVDDFLDKLTEDYTVTTVPELRPVSYPNNFRGIEAEEHCIGCGTCVKVCPMENIRIENGKAVIGDNCATCLSCFHWCPVKAIWMSKQEGIERRPVYRHPEVALEDFVIR